MVKKISLITDDGVKISGNFYDAEKINAPAIIFLHMMPADKNSWSEFAEKIKRFGFQCLAIDLRGHGESDGGPDGFLRFKDQEHQKSIFDVEAAVKFFFDKNIPLNKIVLAGASIGANLALQFQAGNPEIKTSVLLSPGLNYKGIETEPFAKRIKFDQAIFLAAGGRNDEYSTETIKKLFDTIVSKNKQMREFENAGHGTMILKEKPQLMDEIIKWLCDII